MTERQMDEQMSIADLGLWFGKTSSGPCQQETPTEKISESSLKNASESLTPTPLFLDLRTWNGQTWGAFWETDSPSLGEYTTRSFGESPNVAVESRLSQILEDCPPPKYCLSAKACQGILKRAEKRGKILPEILKTALEKQSHSKNDSDALGGGKGILIQNESVGTLSSVFNLHKVVYDASRRHNYEPFGEVAGNVPIVTEPQSFDCRGKGSGDVTNSLTGDHARRVSDTTPLLIEQKAFGISPFESNAMKSGNPHSGIYEADTARTLDLNGGNPSCNQGGMAVVMNENHYGEYVESDQTATIRRRGGTCGGGV